MPVLSTGVTVDATGERHPTVVVDASGRPEIGDLARVHAVEGIGDIATEAAAVPIGDGIWRFFLAVIISSPVKCTFVLEFALPSDRHVLDEAAAAGRLVAGGERVVHGRHRQVSLIACAVLAGMAFAAVALLVREAGGRVCDFDGGDQFLRTNQVIAGNTAVVADMIALLKAHARP